MRKKRGNRWFVILMSCILAVPTVAKLMGFYEGSPTEDQLMAAATAGAMLGVTHIFLRPVLRFIFAPIGCLTLGAFGMVIDVALLYLCDYLVADFAIPGFLYALLTAITVNAICAIAAGRH